MMLIRVLLFAISIFIIMPAHASSIINRDDLLEVFESNSVVGTFVVWDLALDEITFVGSKRATVSYIPASTFKILNSLIALETSVIADENEIVPYGGKPQRVPAWEMDMSIRDAIRISNVPVFQEIARRVGLNRYKEYLSRYGFGNMLVGNEVETFWLKGPLQISAVEYLEFLSKLATGTLPAKTDHQLTVREIIYQGTRGDASLYAKTGWTSAPDPDTGWYVGWVERDEKIFPFALNMDIRSSSDAEKRSKIALRLLSELSIY